MPLQGTFDVLPFADVLELLAGRAATGRLHVRSRTTGANIYLDKGRLVGAEVGDQATTGAQDVPSRLSDVSFELLEAQRGSFEFNPDLTGMGQPTIDLGVGEVLETARRQVEEWRDIQTVVPSLDLHPSLVAELPADEVTLTREQWQVLSALDGRRNVRAVARLLDQSDYQVSRTTKALIESGVVELDAPARPGPKAGREGPAFIDESVAWAPEASGNGDGNGKTDALDGLTTPAEATASEPTGFEPTSEPSASELTVPESGSAQAPAGRGPSWPSATDEADAVWSGNVEDHPAIAAEPPAPPAPAPASPGATTVPIPRPAAPAPAPSKSERPGFLGFWRKNPPTRPNP